MKIAQVVQHLKMGGLEKLVLDLVRHSDHSDEVHLIALEGTKQQALATFPELHALGERLICLNKQPGWQFGIAKQLATVLRQKQVELVHSHHIGPLIYTSLAMLFNTSYQHVHTVHDAWFLKTPRYRKLFKLTAKLTSVELVADAVAVSEEVYQQTGITVPHVILNGIDAKRFKPGIQQQARNKLGLVNKQKYIGCAARLEPGKGHAALFSALQKLPANISLVLAGDGSLRNDLENLAHHLNIHERVVWLGNYYDMPTFYQAIDCFCLFSQREGLPLTLLEAIASGKPAVSTAVGAISEVLTKDFGLVLEPGKTKALPAALLQSLRWRFNKDRLRRFRQNVDISSMCAQYQQLFQQKINLGAR